MAIVVRMSVIFEKSPSSPSVAMRPPSFACIPASIDNDFSIACETVKSGQHTSRGD